MLLPSGRMEIVMDIFNFKCKYCGGEMGEVDGLKSVGKCKYCGSKQTLPKLHDEKRANLFERANHLRRNNEFDKAEALYEQILNDDLTDPEAYWSLVLCRYGVEYVEDARTKTRIPTVNRTQMTSIFGDEDYKSAIANAGDEQKTLYEEEARVINEIQKGILEISQKEAPFDIFICYKESDASGKRTRDSVLAQDLYHELTRDGYKVFFARVTLQGKLGSAYEPYIFSALNSSKVMVVLGTQKDYFEAVWVRNEWSRFLGQIKKGERKVLIPAYRDMDPYDLPPEFSNLQALDMGRLGFMQELVMAIETILASYKRSPAVQKEPELVYAPEPQKTKQKAAKPKKEKKKKGGAIVLSLISLILVAAIVAGVLAAAGVIELPFEIPFLNGLIGGGGDETDSGDESESETKPQVSTSDSKLTFMKLGTGYHVTGIGEETSKDIVIPAEYNGSPVTSIDYGAFANTDIEKVTIPNTVTSIGTSAFENCSSLKNVSIPASVTKIGANAFKNCTALTVIDFNGTQAEWNAITFENGWNTGLSSYTVDCTDTDIVVGGGEETTTGGEGTDIIEPPTPSSAFEVGVGYHAYINQEDLDKTIYLTNQFNTQYTYLLNGTESLEDAASIYFENASDGKYYMYFIEDSVKQYINIELIENNGNSYWNVKLRESASSAWYWSEEYKTLLTDGSNGPMFLGTQKNKGYTEMQSMRIDQDGATSYMLNFAKAEDFDVPTGSTSGLTYEKSSDGTYYIVTGVTATATDVRIPDTYDGLPVTEIKTNAFEGHYSIRSIYVPASVKKIGGYAFYQSSISTIKFASGSQLEEVGYYAFRESKLKSVKLPEGTKKVGEYAFAFCENMTKAEFPQSITDLGAHCFWKSNALKEVVILSPELTIADSVFIQCNGLETVTIPGKITVEPENVTIFKDSLKNAYVHTSVIPHLNNATIEHLTITGGDLVPNSAIINGKNLKTVIMANTVKKIEAGAFGGLVSIESFEFQGTQAEWDSIVKESVWYSGFDPSIVICTGTGGNSSNNDPPVSDYVDPDAVGGNLENGVAYHAVFYHGNLKTKYYLTGSMTGGHNQYLAASTDSAKAATVYIEKLDLGDFYIYFDINGTKLYINIIESTTDGKLYFNPALEEDAITPWCWDVNNDCFVGNYNGNGYFFGTSNSASYDNIALVPDTYDEDNYFKLYFVPDMDNVGTDTEINGTVGDLKMHIKDGVLTISGNGDMLALENYPWADESVTSIVIEQGVTSVALGAFKNMTSLTSVTISETVTNIEPYAFDGCTSLRSVTFGGGVTAMLSYSGEDGNETKVELSLDAPEQNAAWLSKEYSTVHWSIASYSDDVECEANNGSHNYSSLKYDENEHWYECACGEINNVEAHTFNSNNTCYVCKYKNENVDNTSQTQILNGVIYTFNSDTQTYSVTGTDNLTESMIGIHSIVNGYLVTQIAERAFYNCNKITYVQIQSGIERIEEYAFWGCQNLQTIEIPDSVQFIGREMFADCFVLTSVTFPDGVTSIGDSAFYNCYSLTELVVPTSVTSIGSNALWGCSSLTITYKGTEQEWNAISKSDVWADNFDSSKVTFEGGSNSGDENYSCDVNGHSVQGYSQNAESHWQDCTICGQTVNSGSHNIVDGICDVCGYKPENVDDGSIAQDGIIYTPNAEGGYVITGYTDEFTSQSLGRTNEYTAQVVAIADGAFQNCTTLTSLSLTNFTKMTSIGSNAFAGCEYLRNVTLPASLTTIGDGAFANCSKLSIVNLTYAASLTSIGANAFENTGISTLTIPASVTSIGANAFAGCSSLTKVTFSGAPLTATVSSADGVARSLSITNDDAELNATWLTDLYSFSAWTLTDGTNGDGTNGDGANGAVSSGEYAIGVAASDWETEVDGVSYMLYTVPQTNKLYYEVVGMGSDGANGAVVIPSQINGIDVTSIAARAFKGNTVITSVTFNCDKLNYVGIETFEGCTNLTSVDMSAATSLTFLSTHMFYQCDKLSSVLLPNSITSLGTRVFSNQIITDGYTESLCSKLQYNTYDNAYYLGSEENPYLILMKAKSTDITSCIIHDDTKLVYNGAFNNCNLTYNNVANSNNQYLGTASNKYFLLVTGSDSHIDSNTKIIYNSAFRGSSISQITIPEGVVGIGEYAFFGCGSLSSITLPSTLEHMGQEMFTNCYSLRSLTIPEKVRLIGCSMFYNSGLTSLTLKGDIVSFGPNMSVGCSFALTLTTAVREIDDNSFSGVTSVTYQGTEEQWNSIWKATNISCPTVTYTGT